MQIEQYKRGRFFSLKDFVRNNSWNGFEHNCLFINRGKGNYVDVARSSGVDEIKDTRGVAIADFDGDGRLDIVMNNNNRPPTLYRNNVARKKRHWLSLRLRGTQSNRDAIGALAKVIATSEGKRRLIVRHVDAGSGYAAQSDLQLHFGLGKQPKIHRLTIRWPNGRTTEVDPKRAQAALDSLLVLSEDRSTVSRNRKNR